VTARRCINLTDAKVTITIAAFAAVLAVALIAASTAHATCTPSGTPGGGPGNDRMCGTSASETMSGLAGNDQVLGGSGNDLVDGGSGDDVVDGGPGNDVVIGGPGFDTFIGGTGNDQLRARDGQPEALTVFECGLGTDLLDLDLADAAEVGFDLGFPVTFWALCERITVGAVNEGPNVVISPHSVNVGTDGRATVRLRCPASLTAPCAGTLRLGHSAKSQGKKTHYSIDQSKRGDVSIRLSRRDRKELRKRGRIAVTASSVEQGQFGDKTTVQTLKLIAQA
jgi:hypothetical protein